MSPERYLRREAPWRLRDTALTLGRRTLVMGVVNITADSFSDGGRFLDTQHAIEHGLRLLDEGADLLDLGAESTRPGAQAGDPQRAAVSAQEEQNRLLPVIEALLRARPETLLSVDTYKAATARAVVAAGASVVNDVSGFAWDEDMAATCAALRCGVVAMHTRGTPGQWAAQARLGGSKGGTELVAMVRDGLAASMRMAQHAGIDAEALVLDPGYGFGKRGEENYALLARQSELLSLGRPLLAGLSRKSFLGRTVMQRQSQGDAVSARIETILDDAAIEYGGAAAVVSAILQGASIVRVHAVAPAIAAASIADAVLAAE